MKSERKPTKEPSKKAHERLFTRKKVPIVITTILVVLFGLAWMRLYGPLNGAVLVANKFAVGDDWELVDNRFRPNMLDDASTIRRVWKVPTPLSENDFVSILKGSGWYPGITYSCWQIADTKYVSCSAGGSVSNKHNIGIFYNTDRETNSDTEIHLYVD
ncbi:MAG: hypothetical protein LBG75_03355 [Candidatus Nomurabacteria bacterium]|nr:hypothetical protein [Candidatus Nomurabacteria bacterium]